MLAVLRVSRTGIRLSISAALALVLIQNHIPGFPVACEYEGTATQPSSISTSSTAVPVFLPHSIQVTLPVTAPLLEQYLASMHDTFAPPLLKENDTTMFFIEITPSNVSGRLAANLTTPTRALSTSSVFDTSIRIPLSRTEASEIAHG